MKSFLPQPNTASLHEQLRSACGALVGLALAAGLSFLAYGRSPEAMYFIAPMGATAVLLFCLPASPLAQPWPVVAGNVLSALVGALVFKCVQAPLIAAPLAGALAIGAMFALRCLHPPSGSIALTAVLGGGAIHSAGFGFAFFPVGLNSVLMVLGALLYNNLTGRRYPHLQHPPQANIHHTRDQAPTARLGFTPADMDAVLQRYGQVLDVSRDDLESIFLQTEAEAYRRRFGVIHCGDVMSKDVVTLEFATPLEEAWKLMRHHQVHALPVLNRVRRVVGIVSQSDFLRHAELDDYPSLAGRFRHLISRTLSTHSEKPEVVGQIMSTHVQTARTTTPIVELVPLMANAGLHHIPVVDQEDRFAGIVTMSDLVAALYESRLAEA